MTEKPLLENSLFIQDLDNIISDANIPWERLKNKHILVTGATGLIGKTVVHCLLHYAESNKTEIDIYVLVRDVIRAKNTFKLNLEYSELHFLEGDISAFAEYPNTIDYIIHCASNTASTAFVEKPVETLSTGLIGTYKMLNYARNGKISGMVYLSSMEVYGKSDKGTVIYENDVAPFDPAIVRNCYPVSKLACECLCCAYAKEYNLPVVSLRLTQTFGPGVSWDDKRVFAEFMRCAICGNDIVLKTKGDTERCYLYTFDAVRAILIAMLKGQKGEIYNVANKNTYCSIKQMAEIVIDSIGEKKSVVRIEEQDVSKYGYADTLYSLLSTEKIESIGWIAKYDLPEMFKRMASCFEK